MPGIIKKRSPATSPAVHKVVQEDPTDSTMDATDRSTEDNPYVSSNDARRSDGGYGYSTRAAAEDGGHCLFMTWEEQCRAVIVEREKRHRKRLQELYGDEYDPAIHGP